MDKLNFFAVKLKELSLNSFKKSTEIIAQVQKEYSIQEQLLLPGVKKKMRRSISYFRYKENVKKKSDFERFNDYLLGFNKRKFLQ